MTMQVTKELVEKRIGELMNVVEQRRVALDNAVGALSEMQLVLAYINRPDEATIEPAPVEAQ